VSAADREAAVDAIVRRARTVAGLAGEIVDALARAEAAEAEVARLTTEREGLYRAASHALATVREERDALRETVADLAERMEDARDGGEVVALQAAEHRAAADALRDERDAARRAATLAETERDTLRALTDAMRADNVRLRAIVAGRETAPTDAELTTHHDEGGQWLVIRAASPRSIVDTLRSVTDVRAWARSGTPLRWLPLDASGRPCAWPTPALDAAGEGR